jgi:hypothetical protein
MKLLAGCLGLALARLLLALTAPPANSFLLASQAMGDLQERANYVLPVVRLRQLRARYAAAGPAEWGSYLQALSNYETLLGETESAAYRWQQLGVPALATVTGAPLAVQPAASAILARTSTRQVVLFNEAHTQPKGRQLVAKLLPALYRQGFRYLALEALAAEDTAHLQRSLPTLALGYYVAEPHMTNLVREAQRLGFRLVAYDAMSSNREHDQARNLWTATLQRQPRARVLLLAGHAHINERPNTGFKSMAQWLRELIGIDPLTINQTDLDQAAISQLAPAAGAWVVSDAHWQPKNVPTLNDVYVTNHLSPRGIGNMYASSHLRSSRLTIPADSMAPGAAYTLLVYRRAEAQAVPNPVPVATRWLLAGVSSSIQLTLQPDRYVAEVRGEQNKCCWRQQLVIQQ